MERGERGGERRGVREEIFPNNDKWLLAPTRRGATVPAPEETCVAWPVQRLLVIEKKKKKNHHRTPPPARMSKHATPPFPSQAVKQNDAPFFWDRKYFVIKIQRTSLSTKETDGALSCELNSNSYRACKYQNIVVFDFWFVSLSGRGCQFNSGSGQWQRRRWL